jgi:hypothetical protein
MQIIAMMQHFPRGRSWSSFSALAQLPGYCSDSFSRSLVLVPATLLAAAVITTIGFANGLGLGMIALIVFGAAASLQIGYIVGCVLHAVALPALPIS